MNSRESERSSSFAPTDRQGPKWPLHPRATGSGAPRSVPKCRQKRNVPKCRLSPTLEVAADGVDHALGRGLAEHVGCGIGVHKDVHERLQGLDLAARLGDAQIDDDLRTAI